MKNRFTRRGAVMTSASAVAGMILANPKPAAALEKVFSHDKFYLPLSVVAPSTLNPQDPTSHIRQKTTGPVDFSWSTSAGKRQLYIQQFVINYTEITDAQGKKSARVTSTYDVSANLDVNLFLLLTFFWNDAKTVIQQADLPMHNVKCGAQKYNSENLSNISKKQTGELSNSYFDDVYYVGTGWADEFRPDLNC